MRILGSRSFFWQWQEVYAATNPGYLKQHWTVDGVDWTKGRHAYWGDHYSFQFEVHRLEHKPGTKSGWQLLVVTERWWGADDRQAVRHHSWCKMINGRPDHVLAWLRKQNSQGERTSARETAPYQEFDADLNER